MPSSPDITELWGNFKNLVKKIAYDKTEVDDKLSAKANNSLVSQSSNGLMSSTDKVKLDGIATGANKTIVDSSLSSSSTNPIQNKVINTALNGKANSNHSHSVVTTSVDGFMSNDDKVKLNGIATGANKTVVDTALSSSSTNPVQNKIINTALSNKSNINHTHNSLSPTILGANVDFNNYKTEGVYVISWDSVQSATNAPNKTGGRLEVISIQNGVKQIYHNYGSSESELKIWWRNYYFTNKTWFDWQQVVSTKNVSYRQVDNDFVGLPIYCSIKNGFAFLTWRNPFQYLNNTGKIPQTGVYFNLGYVAAPEIDEGSIYRLGTNWRLRVHKDGLLQGFVDEKDAWTYGTWIYPTSSTSLPYPDD